MNLSKRVLDPYLVPDDRQSPYFITQKNNGIPKDPIPDTQT